MNLFLNFNIVIWENKQTRKVWLCLNKITSLKVFFLFETRYILPMLKVVFLLSFLICFNLIFFSFFHHTLFVLHTDYSYHIWSTAPKILSGGRWREGIAGIAMITFQTGLWLQEFQKLESLSVYYIIKIWECILKYYPTYTHFFTYFNVPKVMLKR